MARFRGLGRLARGLARAWPGMAAKGRQIVALGLAAMVVLAFAGLLVSRASQGAASTLPTPTAGQFADNTSTATPAASPSLIVPTTTATTGSMDPTATSIMGSDPQAGDVARVCLESNESGSLPFCPLTVTHIDLTAATPSFTGICTQTMRFDFSATLTVAPHLGPGRLFLELQEGGMDSLSYTSPPPYSLTTTWGAAVQTTATNEITFATDETTKTYHFQAIFSAHDGIGAPMWFALKATGDQLNSIPASTLTSPHADFSFTCLRKITGITASASPSTWSAPCGTSQQFTFTYTMTFTPGKIEGFVLNVEQSQPGFSDWYGTPSSAQLGAPDGPNYTLTWSNTRTLPLVGSQFPNGTYWQKISIPAYNIESPPATITKSC